MPPPRPPVETSPTTEPVRYLATEVTFTLDAQLSGLKRLLMSNAVQKTMDAEVAGLDRAKSVLESRP